MSRQQTSGLAHHLRARPVRRRPHEQEYGGIEYGGLPVTYIVCMGAKVSYTAAQWFRGPLDRKFPRARSAVDDSQHARWGDQSFEGSRRGSVDVYARRGRKFAFEVGTRPV